MIRRSKRLLAGSALALLAATSLFTYLLWPRYPDPLYGNHHLSEHLYRIYSQPRSMRFPRSAKGPPTAKEIAEWQKTAQRREISYKALQKAGPECLPLLTNWLATAPSLWRSNLHARLARHGYYFPRITADRYSIALSCLADFPLDPGVDLTPILIPVLTNLNQANLYSAARLLARTVPHTKESQIYPALRALLPLSYQTHAFQPQQRPFGFFQDIKFEIDRAIQKLDPNRVYHPLVVLELGPIPNRVGAARELAENPRLADHAVPLLIANLASTNRSVQEHCALALAAYRARSEPALPALSNLLTSPRARVRIAASNAISSITAVQPKN